MKQIRLALLAMLMLAPLAQAASKIGVVDTDMVLRESDAGKRFSQQEEKKYAPKIKELKALQSEIQKMEENLRRDGPTLSQTEVESRQLNMRRKLEDLQRQDQQMQAERRRSLQAELARLQPMVQKAIDEVSTNLGYDMTIERGAVRFLKAESDLTRQVIDRMNKL